MPDLTTISGPKLEALIEHRSRRHSALLDEVITAGWGNKTGSDIRAMAAADPSNALAARYVALTDQYLAATDEFAARRRWHGGNKPIRNRT